MKREGSDERAAPPAPRNVPDTVSSLVGGARRTNGNAHLIADTTMMMVKLAMAKTKRSMEANPLSFW